MDRFFEFEKAKLFDTWKRSRNNKYSNPKLQEFHDFFRDFYEKIKNEDIASLTEDKKTFLKNAIDYFQLRVNCLSNNTATNAPYEVIESIKSAAGNWVSNIDDYNILTRYGDYSFFHDGNEDNILLFIKNDYGIEFKYKTVLLSIPQHYYRDYLNNVVLYHEIGHFVDTVNGISDIAVIAMINKFRNSDNLDGMCEFFPCLTDVDFADLCDMLGRFKNQSDAFILKRHWMEYFADMFASSYIGNNITRYLSYVYYPDCNSSIYSSTHPSNKKRFQLVDDFVGGRSNYIINIIQEILQGKFRKKLPRYNNSLNYEDLYSLLPLELNSDDDIHNIYAAAWDVWYGDREKFKTTNNLGVELSPTQIYSILNNLAEKSISNYLVTKKWNNVLK